MPGGLIVPASNTGVAGGNLRGSFGQVVGQNYQTINEFKVNLARGQQ
jgi:hypothetical protein